MAYIEEKFKTREERNARKDELNQTHQGVVIYSNPVKIGMDEKTLKSIYETEWIVAYPQQVIKNVEQLVEVVNAERTTEQEHQAADGVPEVLPSEPTA